MKKKLFLFLGASIGAILGIIFILHMSGLLSLGVLDGYATYDDFTDGVLEFNSAWKGVVDGAGANNPNIVCPQGTITWTADDTNWGIEFTSRYYKFDGEYLADPGFFFIESNNLIMRARETIPYSSCAAPKYQMQPRLQAKKDFKGHDIKVVISGPHTLYLNDVVLSSHLPTGTAVDSVITYEIITSFLSVDEVVLYKNGEHINSFVVPGETAYLKILHSSGESVPCWENICPDTPDAKLYRVKYKSPYNCDVADDEVVVIDSFSEGSTVSLDTLRSGSFSDIHFCLDEFPVQERSFKSDGFKSDELGEVLQGIVRGDEFVVPSGTTWDVFYIAKYSNLSSGCPVGSAWDTQKEECLAFEALCLANNISDPDDCVDYINTNNPPVQNATGTDNTGAGGGGAGSPTQTNTNTNTTSETTSKNDSAVDDLKTSPDPNPSIKLFFILGGLFAILGGGVYAYWRFSR